MTLQANSLLESTASNQLCKAFGIKVSSNTHIVQLAKNAGFDSLFIDLEHAWLSLDQMASLCHVGLLTGISPLVWVPHRCGNGFVQRVLDGGAMGVIFPHIHSSGCYEHLQILTRGCRSMTGQLPQFGLKAISVEETISQANQSASTVFAMIESGDAVERADEIAAVDGVDVVLIGSLDLSIELGVPAQFNSEKYRTALETVSKACRAHGKIFGLAGIYDDPVIQDWAINELGVRFMLVQQDTSLISGGGKKAVNAVPQISLELCLEVDHNNSDMGGQAPQMLKPLIIAIRESYPHNKMGSITPKPTIYLLEVFPDKAVEYCLQHFNTVLPTDSEVNQWRQNAYAILVREKTISAEDIRNASKLRVIGKQGVGIDIIDQEACAARGIPILNTPGANAQSVAELVLALTLAVVKELRPISTKQAAGKEVRKEHCSGIMMTGKTIGIVGMGNIGFPVARMFHSAFNACIYAYDPFAPEGAWKDIPHTRVQEVNALLPHIDMLTLHLPLNQDTRGLISWPQLTLMKPNAILINAAPGGIVNENDLLRALKEGIIWGAGLDCHETEPPVLKDYEQLWATGRVISTPHIGATTKETQVHTATTAMDRVYKYLTELS